MVAEFQIRPARPTDGRPLARLFADVRTEGRWLITTPGSVSEPSEAFWISELIRAAEHLALVAEADGDAVGNVLVNVDRGVATERLRELRPLAVYVANDVPEGEADVIGAVAAEHSTPLINLAVDAPEVVHDRMRR